MRRSIFISGVSSGIGLGLAQYLLGEGDVVYAMNRRKPEALADYANFSFVEADLSVLSGISSALKEVLDGVSQLDWVVLNAGVLSGIKDLSVTTMSEIEHTMTVNVWANKVLLDTLFLLNISVKQVIGVSSGASISGNRGWNAYALSKATLNMLMQLYAAEYPETHFTALAPGLVDTAMQDYLCALPEDKRYPMVDRIKTARGTDNMLSPQAIAPQLVEAIGKLIDYPSGAFVDVRKM